MCLFRPGRFDEVHWSPEDNRSAVNSTESQGFYAFREFLRVARLVVIFTFITVMPLLRDVVEVNDLYNTYGSRGYFCIPE